MQKVFALLLTDLRRLGAIIIYADFSKVVIDTGKFDLSTAKAYCESLLTAVGNRLVSSLPSIYVYDSKSLMDCTHFHWFLCFTTNSDIFELIFLEPAHYWHSLLFMDQVKAYTSCLF